MTLPSMLAAGRRGRRALVLTVALTLSAAPVLAGPAASAQEAPAAVAPLQVDPGLDQFPADPLLGERTPLASDELLLTDPQTGLSFRRVANPSVTALEADLRGDPAVPGAALRPRVVPTAATGAGRVTAPFAERGLTLAAVDGAGTGSDGLLTLTSTSDAADYASGGATLAAGVAQPSAGRTYAITSTATFATFAGPGSLQYVGTGQDDQVVYRPVGAAVPPLVQQWTVVAVDPTTPSGAFLLVSREDGVCLTGDLNIVEIQLCNPASTRQQWRTASPSGTSSSLVNVATGTGLGPVGNGGDVLLNGGGGGITWQEVVEDSPVPTSVALPVGQTVNLPFDLAVADLDGVTDDRGLPRAEAVAVDGDGGTVNVHVVDWNAPGGVLVSEVSTGALLQGDRSPVAVDVADLDGDGRAEIAATYVETSSQVTVVVLRYAAQPDGGRTLERVASTQLGFFGASGALFSSDGAVFDFDGNGFQELAWVGADPNNGGRPTLWTTELQLADGVLTRVVRTTTVLGQGEAPRLTAGWNQHVRVESAALQPATAVSGGRQVVVTWQETGAGAGASVDGLAVGSDGTVTSVLGGAVPTPQAVGSDGVSLAVGGFAAGGGGDSSQWGIAVSAVGGPQDAGAVTLVAPGAPGTTAVVTTQSVTPTTDPTLARTGYELTAYDRQGESIVLGDPLTITVDQLQSLSLLAGQPPAHSDWLAGAFLNVSRTSAFNLAVGTSAGQAFDSTVSGGISGSLKLFGSLLLRGTIEEGIPVVADSKENGGADVSLEATLEGAANRLRANDVTVSSNVKTATGDDDIVRGLVQDYQVTRYPVYAVDSWAVPGGTSGCTQTCNGYYDVVTPGAAPVQITGGGKGLAGFAPSWQNGNALSYPELDGRGQVQITDTGPYTVTGPGGTQVTSSSPLANQQFGVGGTSSVDSLQVTGSSGLQTTENGSLAVQGALDVSGKAKAQVGIPGDEVDGSERVTFTGKLAATLTGSSAGGTTNTHASELELTTPPVDENQGYDYGAAFYYDSTGTSSITYGVDLTGNAQSAGFWTRNYGQQPDLALNLPFSTLVTYDQNTEQVYGTVEWNPQPERQVVRGFVARQADGADGTPGAPLSAAPRPGEQVVFDVPVSNRSLRAFDPTSYASPPTAQFYAVPATAAQARAGDAVPIGGPLRVPAIGSQSSVTLSSPPWTADGGVGGSGQDWRIFVVLDGDDVVDEIHEWAGNGRNTCPAEAIQGRVPALVDPLTGRLETLVCGQNNQGYGRVTVAADDAQPVSATVAADGLATQARTAARLVGAGLGDLGALGVTELGTSSPAPTVVTGDTRTVVLRADADQASPDQRTVVVYEGPPEQGQVVATTTMRGVRTGGGTFAEFQYTPQTDGLHELSAVMLGTGRTEANSGLTVRLTSVPETDAPVPGGSGSVDTGGTAGPGPGTPGAGPADGGSGSDGSVDQAAPGSSQRGGPLAFTGVDGRLLGLIALVGAVLVGAGVLLRRHGSRMGPG